MLVFEDPKQAVAASGEVLTRRELDVLRLMAAGQSNKQIAEGLSITTDTVKTHLKAIFARLAVSNRTEAANVARRLGLLAGPIE